MHLEFVMLLFFVRVVNDGLGIDGLMMGMVLIMVSIYVLDRASRLVVILADGNGRNIYVQ